MARTPLDALKIAAQCNSLVESIDVLRLAHGRKNVVAVPMGDVALPARVLALREGSALAYAPVQHATAPGQVTLDAMKHLYRADRLRRRTRVYGVIGDPIAVLVADGETDADIDAALGSEAPALAQAPAPTAPVTTPATLALQDASADAPAASEDA